MFASVSQPLIPWVQGLLAEWCHDNWVNSMLKCEGAFSILWKGVTGSHESLLGRWVWRTTGLERASDSFALLPFYLHILHQPLLIFCKTPMQPLKDSVKHKWKYKTERLNKMADTTSKKQQQRGSKSVCEILPHTIISFFFLMFLHFWETENTSRGGAERGGHRESKAGSALRAVSPMRGWNSHTLRSWPELKSDIQRAGPPRHSSTHNSF